MLYLASPYSHPVALVRESRAKDAAVATSKLLAGGLHVFSPVVLTHPLAETRILPSDWDFWRGYDFEFLRWCAGMIVLTLEGWQESVGVQAEIRVMMTMKRPVVQTSMHDVLGMSPDLLVQRVEEALHAERDLVK